MGYQRKPNVNVSMCWQLNTEKKCVILDVTQAYATKKWIQDSGGTLYWFHPLPK